MEKLEKRVFSWEKEPLNEKRRERSGEWEEGFTIYADRKVAGDACYESKIFSSGIILLPIRFI